MRAALKHGSLAGADGSVTLCPKRMSDTMNYGLIDQTQIDDLPDDNGAAFVEFERICRDNLQIILSSLGENDDWDVPRLRYMSKVAAAADAYDIPNRDGLIEPHPHNFDSGHFAAFEQAVTQIVTRLQIKNARLRKQGEVRLPLSRTNDIEKYIEVLRQRIIGSDFDENKKKALLKKLEELRTEITGKRADLSKTMLIIASIVTTVNQAEAAVIRLPDAIAAVMKVIGLAKQDEEAARLQIQADAAPKALEDHRRKPPHSPIPKTDDEIPF